MKRIILISILLTVVLFSSANARTGGNFGLGIIVGEPTGLSGKLWMSGRSAVDGGVSWSFTDNASFHLHADYLLHNFALIEMERGSLPLYFGIGGRIKFAEGDRDDKISIRIPVGLDYLFEAAPLDVFIELVPMLDLAPDTDFDFAGGLGFRYYF